MSYVACTVSTRTELAKRLKVTRQALHQWQTEGAPVDEAACMSIDDGVALLRRWRSSNKRPPPSDSNGEPTSLKERLLLAQIDRTEQQARAERLANDELSGRLVDYENIARELAAACALLASRLEELPAYVASDFGTDERGRIEAIIGERVHLFSHELSRTCTNAAGAPLDEIILAAAERIREERSRVNAQPTDNEVRSAGEVDGSGSDDGRRANGVGEQNQKRIPDIGHSGD